MKRTPIQRLAGKLDLDLARVERRLEAEIGDAPGPERNAWLRARFALTDARNHVRSVMSDEDRRAAL